MTAMTAARVDLGDITRLRGRLPLAVLEGDMWEGDGFSFADDSVENFWEMVWFTLSIIHQKGATTVIEKVKQLLAAAPALDLDRAALAEELVKLVREYDDGSFAPAR